VAGTWQGPLVIALHADALSALFALMGTLLGAIVLLYSIGYMAHDRSATRFYATMLVFIGGFVALVYSSNLFLVYLCWEIIGLCSFSLVGFWYQREEAVRGARKVLLMTHLAGYGLLIAVLILYHRAGTALWTDPAIARSVSTGIFLLILLAVLAKSVQFPLHTWIPDAMAAPTPVSSLLHAACYVTAGVYLAARFRAFATWPSGWSAVLIILSSATILVGVLYAIVQTDLKRMLAFSTVSQIGYMLLGIAIGTPLGITAGLLHCLNHGFFKGGLFLQAGAVQHAAGTRDMNLLGGLAGRMPRTTFFWMIGVANMAGIPLMSGFVSKWMLYAAALESGWAIPAVIAWIGSLGTVFVCAKATSSVFLGPATDSTREAHEAPRSMQWAMGLMAAGSIVLGIAPQLAVIGFFQPLLAVSGLGTSLSVTWLGLFTGAGTFSTGGGLVLALLSLVLGAGIFAIARVSTPLRTPIAAGHSGGALLGGHAGGVFTGGEPLWGEDHLTAHDFSKIFEDNWKSFFRWTNVDRAYATVLHQFNASARLLMAPVHWLERHAFVALLAGSVAILALPGIAGSVSGVFPEPLPAPPIPEILIAALCIATVALLYAAANDAEDPRLPLQIAIPASVAIAGCMVASETWRFALLESSAMLSILPVARLTKSRGTWLTYAAVVCISLLCLTASLVLQPSGALPWIRALVLTAVCVKLAAVPFFFWLLRLADEIPAVLLGLIVAVLDMAAIGELQSRAQADPALFAPTALWLVIALLTSLAAALLMLAERHLKRLLVLSSIEDAGFLIAGIACASALGRDGVVLAAAAHCMAKTLLFVSIAAPERDNELSAGKSGLASRYPLNAFAFFMGALSMLGVPPLLGFAGRWKIFEAAFNFHPALLAGFAAASGLALIAYINAFTTLWWGPPKHLDAEPLCDPQYVPPPRAESVFVKAAMLVLIASLLAAGLWPQFVLQGFSGGRP
jgi:multicomponent Na+:H+ antiporter subunit A